MSSGDLSRRFAIFFGINKDLSMTCWTQSTRSAQHMIGGPCASSKANSKPNGVIITLQMQLEQLFICTQ
jgi:hypothetical protein